MALEKSIVKSEVADDRVFAYKPREFKAHVTDAAVDFMQIDDRRKNDFKISELAAQQSGVSKLEEEKSQGLINEQVLEKLKEVQERAYKEAYDLGYLEGSEKGFQDFKNQLTERLHTIDTLLGSIEAIKKNLLGENEAKFVELAFQIGKKIALRDLSQYREAVIQLLQQTVAEMQNEQQVSVHVAAADLEMLEELQKKTATTVEVFKKIKLVPDPSIDSGGCIIDLQYGQVNLTVPDRLDRIWQALEKQIVINQKS